MSDDNPQKPAQDRARSHRAAYYDGPFSIADMEFRPFSVATIDHVHSFGLDCLLGTEPPPEDRAEFLHLTLTLAWSLWAPIDEVNDLALDIDETDTDDDRRAALRRLRRKILAFKSRLPLDELHHLVEKVRKIANRVQDADFNSIDRDDVPDSEDPPGN